MDNNKDRKEWISALSHADFDSLEKMWEDLSIDISYTFIKKPEIGLTQIQGRMGSTGDPFNIGDTTTTKCIVELNSGDIGYSFLIGRNKKHAIIAAVLDGLLQNNDYHVFINSKIIQPLKQKRIEKISKINNETAASKVDFFTMVRGDS